MEAISWQLFAGNWWFQLGGFTNQILLLSSYLSNDMFIIVVHQVILSSWYQRSFAWLPLFAKSCVFPDPSLRDLKIIQDTGLTQSIMIFQPKTQYALTFTNQRNITQKTCKNPSQLKCRCWFQHLSEVFSNCVFFQCSRSEDSGGGFLLVVKTFSKAAAERLRLIKRQLRLTSD